MSWFTVREKKRKRDHDKHGKSEHRRSHKSSRRRRHSRRRSSSSPNNNNNNEYIRAYVNIDDSKCSSRIAMGTAGAGGTAGVGAGVGDDGPSESTVLHRFNCNMDEMLAEVEDVDLSIVYGHEEDEG